MPITPLPTPPSRLDPNNFSARADAFLAALVTFAAEMNAASPGESAAGLAQALADPTGGLLVGITPTGGITATTVGGALAEVDSDWRAGQAGNAATVAAIDARVDALEAGATTGVIGKATRAALDADLAHAADTIALVTNDTTAANNTWYRKTGASSAGSWIQSADSPLGITLNTAAQLAHRINTAVPVYADDVVALKVAEDRWLIRTLVVDGATTDVAEFEMFNWGPYMGLTHAWALHSIRARIGGAHIPFMEQHPSAGNVSTNEFAFKVGKLADYMADARRWTDPAYFDLYGFGHGHMDYSSFGLYLDGGATNWRDISPVGTELRGATLQFSQAFVPKTPDGTAIGTHGVDHTFSSAGLQVAHQVNVTTSGIVAQDCYAAMMATTGVDRIKAIGVAATTVGAEDGSQVGNWGAKATFAAYYAANPTALLELVLPYGGPVGPSGSWAAATTSQTFVLDTPSRIRKLYVNWRSGNVSHATLGDTGTPPPSISGIYSFSTNYRVRLGAAV